MGVAPAYAGPTQPGEPGDTGIPKEAAAEVLGSHDLDLLAEAESAGKRRVTLLVATDRGAASNVVSRLDGLGGTVTRRFDKLGYLLASVSTGKVLGAAKLPHITAIEWTRS